MNQKRLKWRESPSVIFIQKVTTYCTKKIAKAKQTLINDRTSKATKPPPAKQQGIDENTVQYYRYVDSLAANTQSSIKPRQLGG
jgi:hypothetical protein